MALQTKNRIVVWFDDVTADALRARKMETGVSMNELVRRAVRLFVAQSGPVIEKRDASVLVGKPLA